MSSRGKLLIAAVVVHAVSYFLPALWKRPNGNGTLLYGGEAFLITLIGGPYILLWLANPLGWIAAVMTAFGRRRPGLVLAIVATVVAMPGSAIAARGFEQLGPGCWMWAASFAMVGVAAWMLPASPSAGDPPPVAYRV